MLHNLTIVVEPKYINTRPIAVARPFLMTMQDDIIALSENSLKANTLTRVLFRHSLEILDESRLAVGHSGIVLDVNVARILLDRFSGVTLVEHEIVKSHHVLFIPLKLIRH